MSQAVDAAFATNATPGLAVVVHAPDGQLLYSRVLGDFALDRNIAVASGSKMVSGVVLLRLVDQGLLSLDSTTGAVLGWTGPQAAITLRHLLSFTSGLPVSLRAGDDCTLDRAITLAQCAADLSARALVAAPGSRFDYGSAHLTVAARMAEVVTGTAWAQIVAQQLGQPLGWSPQVLFYTAPRQQAGTTNPLVAGGLRITTQEYARLLGVVHNRGTHQGQRLVSTALVDQMGVDPYPAASTGTSPYTRFGLVREYGLTAWRGDGGPRGRRVVAVLGATVARPSAADPRGARALTQRAGRPGRRRLATWPQARPDRRLRGCSLSSSASCCRSRISKVRASSTDRRRQLEPAWSSRAGRLDTRASRLSSSMPRSCFSDFRRCTSMS
ncbi:MAG: beta-lactamase family protein [Ideonella sp.]|nr:beta-lactamase family protein [Ideonella sp.]